LPLEIGDAGIPEVSEVGIKPVSKPQ